MATSTRLHQYLPAGIVCILMIVVPLIFLWSSRTLSGGAETMPRAMCVIIIFCACMSLIKRVFQHDFKETGIEVPWKKVVATAIVLFAFYPVAELVGFYVTSFGLVATGYLVFAQSCMWRNVLFALVTATCFTVAAWLFFYKTLSILTPTGMFI